MELIFYIVLLLIGILSLAIGTDSLATALANKRVNLLSTGWLTAIRQMNKAIRRKNKLIKRLRYKIKELEGEI